MNNYFKCKYCGIEMDWDGVDAERGCIWECGETSTCAEMFCEKCFIEVHGYKQYKEMLCKDDIVRCPDCYSKHKE